MAEYYLTPEATRATQKALLKQALLFAAIMLIGGVGYGYWGLHADSRVLLLVLVTATGVSTYSYFRNLKQQKLAIESYRLVVNADGISRFTILLPPIELAAVEIATITQHAQGNLAITTADKYRAIYVPAHVTDRPALLLELARFAPLTVVEHKTWTEKLMPLIVIGMLGLMGLFYTVSNKIISTITGLLLLGILTWSYWHIWRNKNLPRQSRRLLWFMPLLLLSIAAGMIARLLQ
ncbi:MAG: hypothetical protein EOO60_12510 [Hymenobacter sp.]|nr:MAG: hypothetical protein EOO60_12510 [Hymenobacter sp.]